MKKTKLKRKSKSEHRQLMDALWDMCKQIVSMVYGEDCYTCPAKNLVGRNKHLGHVPWPESTMSALLKRDIRVLRYQCYRCNIHHGGMGGVAYKKMLREEGAPFMEQLEKEKNNNTTKADDHYRKLIKEYTEQFPELFTGN